MTIKKSELKMIGHFDYALREAAQYATDHLCVDNPSIPELQHFLSLYEEVDREYIALERRGIAYSPRDVYFFRLQQTAVFTRMLLEGSEK